MALTHTYASGVDLPPELYPLIIQNIYHASDLKVASLVSSEWRAQAQKDLFPTLHLPKNMNKLVSLSNDIRGNYAILSGVRTIEIPDPYPTPPQDLFEAVNKHILSIFESRNQLLCVNIQRSAEVLDGQLFDRLMGRTHDSESDLNQNAAVDFESNLTIGTHQTATTISCISTIRFDQPLIYGLTSDIFDTLGPSLSGLSLTESCSMTRANLNTMGGNRLEEFWDAMKRQLERDWTEEPVERRKVRRLAVDVHGGAWSSSSSTSWRYWGYRCP
jgi:hypothetical protein